MAQFTFDGPNKLIIGSYSTTGGVFTADTAYDLYSRWKEWVADQTNSRYVQAFTTIGGDPLPGSIYAGAFYFLENGWKIRPIETNHRLVITGNLYARDGSSPFTATLGTYNVLTEIRNSSLTQALDTGGGGVTGDEVWTHVLGGKTAGQRLIDAEDNAELASIK